MNIANMSALAISKVQAIETAKTQSRSLDAIASPRSDCVRSAEAQFRSDGNNLGLGEYAQTVASAA